ncbi:MAG: hypothetical protein Q9201_001175 [Fulgogasparrea decipioides]
MSSVPLHCNICPKGPDFSDISHLLTHIGSKGHLSHYFKAQVRGRQDASVRQQLDVYDRWYTEHQIEKLLSQRMVLKDSKRPNGTARATNKDKVSSAKPSKAPRIVKKKTSTLSIPQPPADAKPENVIDPRLSQPLSTSAQQRTSPPHSPALGSPGFDLTSLHRNPIPCMRTFRTTRSNPAVMDSEQQLPVSPLTNAIAGRVRDDSDTETDDGRSTRSHPASPIYPEPPTTEGLLALMDGAAQPSFILPPPSDKRRRQSGIEENPEPEKEFIPQTPELKGVYYPGMSLFDSASPEAQRKRNQRKDESLVAQIQRESLEVECNEYIYWPDGSLKMCRFITGDVQSSPFKEDTPPPPPPPKRPRGRRPKATNGKVKQGKHKTIQDPYNQQAVKAELVKQETSIPDFLQLPRAPSATLDSWLSGYPLAHGHLQEEEDQWLLNMGEPSLRRRRHVPSALNHQISPRVFGDALETHPNPLVPFPKQPSLQNGNSGDVSGPMISNYALENIGHPESMSHGMLMKSSVPRAPMELSRPTGTCRSNYTVAQGDKENLPPQEPYFEQVKDMVAHGLPRSTQCFFTVKDNQAPQMATTLPAEMAFAGMATPSVYRRSLNPLNPNAHLRRSLPYSSHYTPFHMPRVMEKSNYASQATLVDQAPGMQEDADQSL